MSFDLRAAMAAILQPLPGGVVSAAPVVLLIPIAPGLWLRRRRRVLKPHVN